MKIGRDIPTRGVTLLLMISKGEKDKYQKRNNKSMKTWGTMITRGV